MIKVVDKKTQKMGNDKVMAKARSNARSEAISDTKRKMRRKSILAISAILDALE